MIKRSSKISFFQRGVLLLILVLASAISGCKKETPPPPQATPLPNKAEPAPLVTTAPNSPVKPVQTASSSARKAASPSTVQKQMSTVSRLVPPSTVILDFASRRDPFKPYAQMKPLVDRSARNRGHEPLPIQSFDAESFKVTGIITGLKENTALIVDPKGKGYVVKAGMQIGSNDGFVKSISNSTVVVEESFRDDNGRVRKRLVKLMLLRKK